MGHPSGPELLEGSRCINLSNTMVGVIASDVIKTHDSESRGQEEAAVRDERVSYLQVAPLKNSQTL